MGEQGAELQALVRTASVQPVVAVPLDVTHVPASHNDTSLLQPLPCVSSDVHDWPYYPYKLIILTASGCVATSAC